jgi:hypothetical protein
MSAYFVVELEITNMDAMAPTGRRLAPRWLNMAVASSSGPARPN